MDLADFLIARTQREVDALFEAARRLPVDKLDWKPAPGARSALDQLQEVATSVDAFWDALAQRKIAFSPEMMAAWNAERMKLTDLDVLEAKARESYERVYGFIRSVRPEDWSAKVEMPFPGEFDLAYIVSYYLWNGAYHEGQINYIANLLESDAGA